MKVEALLWVLILVSLVLAIVSRRYRKWGLVVVGLAVVTIVVVIVHARNSVMSESGSSIAPAQHSKRVDFEQLHIERLDREDPGAKARITVSELRFDQIRPIAGLEPGTIESIRARLHNDSARFTLTDYAYSLVVQDCVAEACSTIYVQRGRASSMVPARQARDVAIEIRSGETRESPAFQLLGTPRIALLPTETRAYTAASTP